MLISNSVKTDYLSFWIECEQYLTSGSKNYSKHSDFSEVPAKFQPGNWSAPLICPLPGVATSEQWKAKYLQCGIKEIDGFFWSDEGVLYFPIHPAAEEIYKRRGIPNNSVKVKKVVSIEPTASTRTVAVRHWPCRSVDVPLFLKLDLPLRISRFNRALPASSVRHQLWVSSELRELGLDFLRDIAGGYISDGLNTDVGFIIRQTQPSGLSLSDSIVLPGFALFGEDIRSPDDPTLISQLVKIYEEEPIEFVRRRIIQPLVTTWVKCVTEAGIYPELHAQNTLFHFNLEKRTSGVFFRDLDLWVDLKIREDLGLANDRIEDDIIRDFNLNGSHKISSLSWDVCLVNHFLLRLGRSMERGSDVNFSLFCSLILDSFRETARGFYPFNNNIYYFSEGSDDPSSIALEANESFIKVR